MIGGSEGEGGVAAGGGEGVEEEEEDESLQNAPHPACNSCWHAKLVETWLVN